MQTLKLTKKYERYPEYKDSGVEWLGKIPKGWQILPLRSVSEENQERNATGANSRLLSLSYGKIVEKDINTLEGLLPESFSTYQIVRDGYVVFRLTDLQNDKKSLRVGFVEPGEPGMITSAYLGLKIGSLLDKKFAYYLLHAYDLMKVYYGMGGGVRQVIDFSDMKYLPTIFPEIVVQQKIAKYLDEKTGFIDQIIEKKEKLIELLREKRTAVINHAVTKGLDSEAELVESGIDWIGKIPKGWELRKIKHLVKSVDSGIWGEEALMDSNDIKCLRVADFDYENLGFFDVETIRNNTGLSTRKILKKGDILVEKSGGGEKTPVGRAIMFNSEEKMVCANFIDIVRVDSSKVLPEFLTLILSWLYSGRINTKYIKQNTGIQNLDLKDYSNESVGVPSVKIQREIAGYVFEKIEFYRKAFAEVEKSIEVLQEFKSSLISNVVTGKIKV